MAGLAGYRRQLLPGRSDKIGARGKTIVVRDVVGEVVITARSSQVGSGGGQAYSLVMRKFEKWFCPEEFDSVEVQNTSSDTITVELLIGYGDFVREVTSRTIAGSQYNATRQSFELEADSDALHQFATENLQRKKLVMKVLNIPTGCTLENVEDSSIVDRSLVAEPVTLNSDDNAEAGNRVVASSNRINFDDGTYFEVTGMWWDPFNGSINVTLLPGGFVSDPSESPYFDYLQGLMSGASSISVNIDGDPVELDPSGCGISTDGSLIWMFLTLDDPLTAATNYEIGLDIDFGSIIPTGWPLVEGDTFTYEVTSSLRLVSKTDGSYTTGTLDIATYEETYDA